MYIAGNQHVDKNVKRNIIFKKILFLHINTDVFLLFIGYF